MKKIFISLFLSGVFMYHTNAQTAVEGNKFLDNWSIGISAGGTTPLTHHSFFGNMRPITGIELNKHDISKKVAVSYLIGSIIENSEPCPGSETTLI